MSGDETNPASGAGEPPTAALLIIGNEILSGRTQDANLQALARFLGPRGFRLAEVRVIPDIEARIVEAVRVLSESYDLVFTTGGIGPTHDDITAESIAKAFGVELREHPEARATLEAFYGLERLNEGRRKMMCVPDGASLIANPVSAAPGFKLGNVHVLAGIPKVMRAMLEVLAPGLEGGRALTSLSVGVSLPESVVAPGLGALQKRYPDVEIGSYPFEREGGGFAVSLVLRGIDLERLEAARAELVDHLRSLGGVDVTLDEGRGSTLATDPG